MPKKGIHPKWISNTRISCDDKLICLINSTKPNLNIDIWLGNHPFYTNSQKIIDTEGRVEKFLKKYQLDFNN
uniref:50S ribosomal protein L31 n=1 Tax=Astrosyne radiata TaxID=1158023 RepID=A0A2U9NTA8_9STRA|nr:ribosomal protein L31 [Astrosyne radiata]AWT40373.1 ribosomal protein L31 [Astrosyne radiata]